MLIKNQSRLYGIVFKVLLLLFSPLVLASPEKASPESLLEQLDQIPNPASDEAKAILDQIEAMYDQLTIDQQSRYKLNIAKVNLVLGDYNKTESILLEEQKKTISNKIRLRIHNVLTYTYQVQNDFPRAFSSMLSALQLIDVVYDPFVAMGTLQIAATVYRQVGYYDLSISSSHRLYSLAKETSNLFMECLAHAEIGVTNVEKGDFNEAKKYLSKADKTCTESNYELSLYLLKVYQARISLIENRLEESLAILNQVKKYSQGLPFKAGDVYYFLTLSEVYYALNDFENAKTYAHLAKKLGKDLNQQDRVRDAYKVLMDISSLEKKPGEAYEYSKKYISANDAYINAFKSKSTAFEMARHNNLDQLRQIETLNQQKKFLELEKKLEKRTRLYLKIALASGSVLFLVLLVWLAGVIKQRKQLRIRAETDILTGAYNRSYLFHKGKDLVDETIKNKKALSLILFDLDYFKKINDNYGHSVGDWVLENTVKVISKQVRDTDIFARVGGEEFVVCLPETNVGMASAIAERCRVSLLEMDTSEHEALGLHVSASFGVTCLYNRNIDLDALIAEADEELYKSKEQGRNCINVRSAESADKSMK